MNQEYTISADTIVSAMNWRYATKAFDRNKQLADADRAALLTALRLSPSSYGLQPWKFLVVDDNATRSKLGEAVPANKSKIEDSSMLVVLARRRVTTAQHVEQHVQTVKEARGVSAEELQPFKNMLTQSAAGRPAADQDVWNARQVYVALGCALTTAAMLKVDACPMEGVNPEKFDQTLGLAGSDFTTTAAIAFGYRDKSDPFASYSRARRAASEVIEFV
ncbi:NAD(P)H-dependent oxidoreductase [Ruegeria arenilitoris]|uniref:NAD(P)H-dependent oxidoreductase n=1 Tax=Ruegeria arenilitoris TaxID=1173585 RepID=UPI00147BDD5D|nr:NAD(P)H-dependent oxidoreductase [Ruegeria arenilitoris]